jgi:hypothetical protein
VPSRCLNVTAILSSFAEHKSLWMVIASKGAFKWRARCLLRVPGHLPSVIATGKFASRL